MAAAAFFLEDGSLPLPGGGEVNDNRKPAVSPPGSCRGKSHDGIDQAGRLPVVEMEVRHKEDRPFDGAEEPHRVITGQAVQIGGKPRPLAAQVVAAAAAEPLDQTLPLLHPATARNRKMGKFRRNEPMVGNGLADTLPVPPVAGDATPPPGVMGRVAR